MKDRVVREKLFNFNCSLNTKRHDSTVLPYFFTEQDSYLRVYRIERKLIFAHT